MGLFHLFSGNNKDTNLILPNNFETNYLVETKNKLIMGKENPVISLTTTSEIFFKQIIDPKKRIINRIETKYIKGSTDHEIIKPNLEQLLLLGDISKRIILERNLRGRIQSVNNLQDLLQDWLYWKETKSHTIFPDERERKKFIQNYEKGFFTMEKSIQNNLQYLLLMPEIYHFKNYVSVQNPDQTSPMEIPSKLVPDMIIQYILKSEEIKHSNQIHLNIRSNISNGSQLIKDHLASLYENHKDYALQDYTFFIDINYTFEKETAKIIKADFLLLESLHDDLEYQLKINLKEL